MKDTLIQIVGCNAVGLSLWWLLDVCRQVQNGDHGKYARRYDRAEA